GSPIPSISDATPINTSVISRLPSAHSTIISENALPRPVVVTTFITSPTATSKTAVAAIVLMASTTASKHRLAVIGVLDSQESAITASMANETERTGVKPATSKATSTARGPIKCQPSRRTATI